MFHVHVLLPFYVVTSCRKAASQSRIGADGCACPRRSCARCTKWMDCASTGTMNWASTPSVSLFDSPGRTFRIFPVKHVVAVLATFQTALPAPRGRLHLCSIEALRFLQLRALSSKPCIVCRRPDAGDLAGSSVPGHCYDGPGHSVYGYRRLQVR